MKRRGLVVDCVLIAIWGLLVAAFFLTKASAQQAPGKPSPTPPQVIQLALNTILPPTDGQITQVMLPWMREIEQRTGGRVKIVPYYGGVLSTTEENYRSVITGRADIGHTYMFLPAGKFPIMDLLCNFVSTERKTDNYTAILNQLYKEFPSIQEETKETKVLSLYITGPDLFIAKKSLKTFEDLKGRKMLASGRVASKKLAALGTTPVTMSTTEVFMALEKGILDGGELNISTIITRKFPEVAKHTVTNAQLGRGPFYVVMNLQTWNRLPKDIQGVFDELSSEFIKKWDEYFRDLRLAYAKRFVEEFGGTTYEWSSEDIAKINERWKPLENSLIGDLEAKGYPARKIMDRFHELESKM